MDTTLSYHPLSKVKISFVWYLPLYCLGLTGAYILASTVFPVTIGKDKFLGFALSNEQTFNQPLFVHLTAGIIFIALAHLITRLMAVKISTGNAILALLLTLNIFCFVIGINTPLLNTTKIWIIKEHLSLTQVLSNLKLKGEMQLYYIMLIFTFIIPVLKMIAMAYDIFLSKADSRKNLVLSFLSKWAMLDVMIAGVIVSTMKSGSGFAELTTGTGFAFFISSILLSLVISSSLQYTKNS
jgi:uncharacterized paraquat-inducible protein A